MFDIDRPFIEEVTDISMLGPHVLVIPFRSRTRRFCPSRLPLDACPVPSRGVLFRWLWSLASGDCLSSLRPAVSYAVGFLPRELGSLDYMRPLAWTGCETLILAGCWSSSGDLQNKP